MYTVYLMSKKQKNKNGKEYFDVNPKFSPKGFQIARVILKYNHTSSCKLPVASWFASYPDIIA